MDMVTGCCLDIAALTPRYLEGPAPRVIYMVLAPETAGLMGVAAMRAVGI